MSRRNIRLPTDELVARYEAGESTLALGRTYGASSDTVRDRLRAAGVKMRSQGGARKIHLPRIDVLYHHSIGESPSMLARRYGVSATHVSRQLRAWGLEPHRISGARKPGGPLHLDAYNYFTTRDREGKLCKIHRGCWEAYHGLIPDGHVVHHVDGDVLNNGIENLECLTHKEHAAAHNGETKGRKETTNAEA